MSSWFGTPKSLMDSTRSLSHLMQSGSLTWSSLNCKNKIQHDNSNWTHNFQPWGPFLLFTWGLWRYSPQLSLKSQLSHLHSRTGELNRVSGLRVIISQLFNIIGSFYSKKKGQVWLRPLCCVGCRNPECTMFVGKDDYLDSELCKKPMPTTCTPALVFTFSRFLSPSVDGGKSPPIPYIYVNSSGSVKNYRPMQVVLACSLEMYAFPFDKQNCSLTFRSWLHSGSDPETQPA